MPRCITLAILATTFLLAACGVPKQRIPVSTNPIGATIFADGKKKCVSPCAIDLDKKSDHLITIVKEGFDQEDIIITRRFMPDEAIRDGAISGILRGGDPKDVAGEVAKEVDEQERSGEAYELVPSIIAITLTPTSTTANE